MSGKHKVSSVLYALLASVLFGASIPLAKILIGNIEPVLLAALLYLGSGAGLLITRSLFSFFIKSKDIEAGIKKDDIRWLIGAMISGGILAPILLMVSLKYTPASTASLLLNYEGVATTFIAALIFGESIGKKIKWAIGLNTVACILLSWNFNGDWGFSLGAIGILLACMLWGIDNNLTRHISAKDPGVIVIIKSIGAGLTSLLLSVLAHNQIPGIKIILITMLLGFACYGVSLIFFIFAMRGLGASRTSALFSLAPFMGVILSFVIFREMPVRMFYFSLPIIIYGTYLILYEKHIHEHTHENIVHEHHHRHDDDHHNHEHSSIKEHSHPHQHEYLVHIHQHTPDIYHRHSH